MQIKNSLTQFYFKTRQREKIKKVTNIFNTQGAIFKTLDKFKSVAAYIGKMYCFYENKGNKLIK